MHLAFFHRPVDNTAVALVPRCHLWKSHAIIRRQIWAAAVWSKFGLFLPLSLPPTPSSCLLSFQPRFHLAFEPPRFELEFTRARSSPGTDVLIGQPACLEASIIAGRSKDDAFARHLLINDVFRGRGRLEDNGCGRLRDVDVAVVEWRWRSERAVVVFWEFSSWRIDRGGLAINYFFFD